MPVLSRSLIGDRTATGGDAAKRPRPAAKQWPSTEAREQDRVRPERLAQACRWATAASSAEPDHPDPQSQSLSRSYGSNLPTSLTYIILSTRGCSPWRPAADMGTSWRESAVTSPGFSRSSRLPVDAERTSALFARAKTHSPCETIQGPRRLMQKRQLFPGLRPASPGRVALPRRIRGSESVPRPGSGIWTGFPFGVTAAHSVESRDTAHLIKASPKP